jgi:hypothetical protein
MEEQARGVDLVRGGAEDVTITAACVRRSEDLSKPLASVSQSSRSNGTRRQIISVNVAQGQSAVEQQSGVWTVRSG